MILNYLLIKLNDILDKFKLNHLKRIKVIIQ